MQESPIPHDQVPAHIAIIMDGNGRWAEAKNLSRPEGHVAGAVSVKKVVKRCVELGVSYLTLYSFSTENWVRPESEIDALMGLLILQLTNEVPELTAQGIRIKHIGNRDKFSIKVLEAIDTACEATEEGETLTLILALDYSGRSEMLQAAQKLIDDAVEATQENLEARLFTAGTPDPDLLIRTAGEYRVSNFLLWQIAYSEIYVTQQCWPDFNGDSLDAAIIEYASRTRKFGAIN